MNKSTRSSNIEAMRLVLLLMVICLHVTAPYLQTRFIKAEFNWQFAGAVSSLSRIATNCFVLISGFFYTSRLKEGGALKTLKKLLLPIAVYFPFYFCLILYDKGSVFAALKESVKSLALNDSYFYHLWFAQIFIVVSLLAPFLAKAVEEASRRAHLTAIAALFGACAVIPSFVYMTGLQWFDLPLFDSKLLLFLALFILGAYVRKYPPDISAKKAGLLFLLSEIIVVIGNVWYNSKYSPFVLIRLVTGSISYMSPEMTYIETYGFSGVFSDTSNVFIIIASAFMLIFVSKIEIKGKFVAKAAKNIYGAYIIHVFWIQILSNINNGCFDLYSADWLDNPVYPLFVTVFVMAAAALSLTAEQLMSSLIALIKKRLSPKKPR